MLRCETGWQAVLVGTLLALAPGLGLANQYWVSYEGNDYPENEGWERHWYPAPADRRLEDGSLVLDMHEPRMAEWYEWYRDQIDPGPDEWFVMRWRLRVDDVNGGIGPVAGVISDDQSAAAFEFRPGKVVDVFYGSVQATYEPGLFHSFEFRSYQMQTYELYIDDQFAMQGQFLQDTSLVTHVLFGHGSAASSSLTHWDYLRFGVVPEPSSGLLIGALMLVRRLTVGRRSTAT